MAPPYHSDRDDNERIIRYTDEYREQMLEVWEKSVAATHDFLSSGDFEEIKAIVRNIHFNDFDVYCLVRDHRVLGFIGLTGQKIEMLFLSPESIGKGLGKKLTDFALSALNANQVDVNEQNTRAVLFYKKMGFKIYERTDRDDQGKDYPLLRMKLDR